MALYVKVGNGEEVSKFPLAGTDGDLSLEVLKYKYPTAKGLLYVDEDGERW